MSLEQRRPFRMLWLLREWLLLSQRKSRCRSRFPGWFFGLWEAWDFGFLVEFLDGELVLFATFLPLSFAHDDDAGQIWRGGLNECACFEDSTFEKFIFERGWLHF
jgi:hypothetical protein